MSIVYVLKTVSPQMTGYGGFKYPRRGPVVAKDWRPDDKCGGGLHGLPNGCGNAGYVLFDVESAVWLVIKVDTRHGYVHGTGDMTDKCKFRRGTVVYSGKRAGAVAYLDKHGCADKPVVFAARVGGDRATVTGGDRATVTGGDEATVTGGYGATVTGGYGATVTGGNEATVTGGDGATVTGGYGATVTGGNEATVTGGWYDGNRYRLAVAYVGENGIKPDTPYRVDDHGNFTEET